MEIDRNTPQYLADKEIARNLRSLDPEHPIYKSGPLLFVGVQRPRASAPTEPLNAEPQSDVEQQPSPPVEGHL